jgi:hypothetical protein
VRSCRQQPDSSAFENARARQQLLQSRLGRHWVLKQSEELRPVVGRRHLYRELLKPWLRWSGKSLVLNPFKIEEQLGRFGTGDDAQAMRPVGARGDYLHMHDGWDIRAGPDHCLRIAVSRTDPMDCALPRRISEPELV